MRIGDLKRRAEADCIAQFMHANNETLEEAAEGVKAEYPKADGATTFEDLVEAYGAYNGPYETREWLNGLATKDRCLEFDYTCRKCGTAATLAVRPEDYISWKEGRFVQDAFPYLTADERELMMSRTCGTCYDSMFPFGAEAENN